MAIDRKAIALNWLQRIHRELKPNATLDVFINSLRLNSFGDALIPEPDFQAWIQSKGEMINISQQIADKVRTAIIVKYSSNKNMLPTRATIDSAFLNLATASWGYTDAIKATSLDLMKTGKVIADAAGNLTYAVTKVTTNMLDLFSNKWVFYGGAAFVGFLVWMNKDTIGKALTGGMIDIGSRTKSRAVNAAGKLADKAQAKMKLNPSKRKISHKRK